MDVVMHNGTNRHLVDVCVTSPFAGDSRYVTACARRNGYSSRRAAIAKRNKYNSPELAPFALETGGRLGADARALLKLMASHADDPTAELNYYYRAVSSVLQDGVARQILGK